MTFLQLLIRVLPIFFAILLIMLKLSYIKNRGKHFVGRLKLQYIGYYDKEYIKETSSQQKKEFMHNCNLINTGIIVAVTSNVCIVLFDILF
jgi:hypothetical protein